MRRACPDWGRAAALAARTLGWEQADIVVARRFMDRLLGMAVRMPPDRRAVMCFPACRSVHTWGMRYPLDIAFIDRAGNVMRLCRNVGPGHVLRCADADAVLERAAISVAPFRHRQGSRGACGQPACASRSAGGFKKDRNRA